jgi:hypothetical protein
MLMRWLRGVIRREIANAMEIRDAETSAAVKAEIENQTEALKGIGKRLATLGASS